ncbi:MAG: beta-ketoacyl synthase N-terminal-like domain-containing protein [Terrimicrobiaceae bacterium]
MSGSGVSILGIGCVTPLGRDWEAAWGKICEGARPDLEMLEGPPGFPSAGVFKTALPDVPAGAAARLRRSSAISYFSCAAAADAVQQSGPLPEGRTALIFAASNGAVVYTRRFYADVVTRGSGSPLLFPETVYNAPASHVAAMLGLDGAVLTLVSDATSGMSALGTAADLLQAGAADRCLVVGAEELDWISWEGYRRWKFAATHATSGEGAILSEGAVALVLGPSDTSHVQIERVHPGKTLLRRSSAHRTLRNLLQELVGADSPDLAVLSASGTRPGRIEESVVSREFPDIRLLTPKKITGEAFAASTLLQCLCAWQEIRQNKAAKVLVPVLGWGGQAGGALLAAPGSER